MCYYMIHKSAIIKIRKRLGIPQEGFLSDKEALAWYRDHYYQTKGNKFSGTFGFLYDRRSGYIDFEYEIDPEYLKVYVAHPLDNEVPLDREARVLAEEINISGWSAPWLRLVILVGEPPEDMEVHVPDHLMAPLGGLRVLVHPATKLSLRKWREIGALMGLLPGDIDLWKVPGSTTTYSPKRQNSNELLYWQTYQAYMDAIGERRLQDIKGKKGLLVDTARILVRDYGWNKVEESYTIRRYLDRAEKIWHVSML
jgi:hypothetical protein